MFANSISKKLKIDIDLEYMYNNFNCIKTKSAREYVRMNVNSCVRVLKL